MRHIYPRGINVIITTGTISSMASGIVQSISPLYFHDFLHLRTSTYIKYNITSSLLGGALHLVAGFLADCYIGYYPLYVVGQVFSFFGGLLIPISTMRNVIDLNTGQKFALAAMVLAVTQSAIVSPSGMCFIGDQFKLPRDLETFTSYFLTSYLLVNVALTFGQFIGPLLRRELQCFHQKFCFAVPMWIVYIISATSSTVVLSCWRIYTIKKAPWKNVVKKVIELVIHARRQKKKATTKRKHWLDYADDKYSPRFIADVKRLRVLLLFLPFPFFWAMFSQEFATWIHQARSMDSDIGSYSIPADQMITLNTLFCVILVPIFEHNIYPWLKKYNILTNRLHRMTVGGVFFFIAYVTAGILACVVESTEPPSPLAREAQLRIFNNMNCDMYMVAKDLTNKTITIPKMSYYENMYLKVPDKELSIPYSYTCGDSDKIYRGVFEIPEKMLKCYHFSQTSPVFSFQEDYINEPIGGVLIRTLISTTDEIFFTYVRNGKADLIQNSSFTGAYEAYSGLSSLFLNGKNTTTYWFKRGGVYVVLLQQQSDSSQYDIKVLEVRKHHTIHVFWMIPQYIFIVIGEIMFVVTQSEFVYTQAPVTMKGIVNAFAAFSSNVGELIAVLLLNAMQGSALSHTYFTFAGVMSLNLLVFTILTRNYKTVEARNTRIELPS